MHALALDAVVSRRLGIALHGYYAGRWSESVARVAREWATLPALAHLDEPGWICALETMNTRLAAIAEVLG